LKNHIAADKLQQ